MMFATATGPYSFEGEVDTTNIIQLRAQETMPKYPDLVYSAQKANALFGASSTVQPAGLYVQCLIRYL